MLRTSKIIEIRAGTDIKDAVINAFEISAKENVRVIFSFNGVEMSCDIHDKVNEYTRRLSVKSMLRR